MVTLLLIMGSESCSVGSRNGHKHAITVMKTLPLPDEWTMIREVNIEKRDPCEVNAIIVIILESTQLFYH